MEEVDLEKIGEGTPTRKKKKIAGTEEKCHHHRSFAKDQIYATVPKPKLTFNIYIK